MVEVVFSDSEKGAMRYGQHLADDAGGAVSALITKSDGTQPTPEEYTAALAEAERKRKQELR